ncbi:amino acid ABC transporter permease [Priestia megaterium]|nr:amino acid ABC transporter permease [Priestia megaterium]
MEGFRMVWDDMPLLLKGAWVTIEVAILSIIFATIIGLIFGLFRVSQSRILQGIAKVYISIIRGTPLLVQIIFFTYGLMPLILAEPLPEIVYAVIVLSLNAGAYLCEVFRAGIESIDKGQREAGRAIGFTHSQTLRYIILPQAIKRMIPTFMNQFIITFKDTSLLATIAVAELTYTAQTLYAINYQSFAYLAAIAIMYWIMITFLTYIANLLERKLI